MDERHYKDTGSVASIKTMLQAVPKQALGHDSRRSATSGPHTVCETKAVTLSTSEAERAYGRRVEVIMLHGTEIVCSHEFQ